MIRDRSIQDMDQGGEVNLPARDISEPTFHHGQGGDREMVHPGNREFAKGDTFDRPQGGGQGQGGSEPGEGEAVDQFTFSLSRAEFLNLFFEDLELPNLARNQLGEVSQRKWQRAGYTTSGSPSMLSISRTLKSSLARRVALSVKARADLEDAEERLAKALGAGAGADEIRALEQDVEDCRERLARVPFLDDLDLRYRNRVSVSIPMARAVMFCLMDVSGSMDEGKKDLAKRFFTLLYLFLSRKYEHVDLVFIRHTDNAEEVDERTFFYDPKSGGTIVLSALELMREILEKRYPPSAWNVYAAQASDGDSFGADAGKSARFLAEHLLPATRYFAYIEVPDSQEARKSSLWAEYEQKLEPHFVMRRICDRGRSTPCSMTCSRRKRYECHRGCTRGAGCGRRLSADLAGLRMDVRVAAVL